RTITPSSSICKPNDKKVVTPRRVLILPADSTMLSSNIANLHQGNYLIYRHRWDRFCSRFRGDRVPLPACNPYSIAYSRALRLESWSVGRPLPARPLFQFSPCANSDTPPTWALPRQSRNRYRLRCRLPGQRRTHEEPLLQKDRGRVPSKTSALR